jgi:ribosomal protein S18 acetylase RimI-like enzyme
MPRDVTMPQTKRDTQRTDQPPQVPGATRHVQYAINIRPMAAADVARLAEIDSNFESSVHLDVRKEVNGLNVTWRLIERPLDPPFVCNDFDFDAQERRQIARRFEAGKGLWLVAEPEGSKRLVGMVDVQRQDWREAGFVWNIAIDRPYRGRGLGRRLMKCVLDWGRREGLRAIILETQTNNWPACRFYHCLGFQLTGVDDHYYTNQDITNKEVALFWTYEL